MASKKTPKARFVLLGGKVVHVVHTEAWDRKNSQCMTVRKKVVAGKVPSGSMSPEAAMALDECKRCGTHKVAKEALPPEAKRAERAEKRDQTLAKTSATKTKSKRAAASPKVKDPKPKKISMTKSGPRSTASRAEGDPTEVKARMLADFGKEHGWRVKITKDDDTGHTVVTAVRGDETITAWFIDGKYDINRHAETRVGSWTGKLRGAHGCRRQMANEGRDRIHPNPGKGRGGPRKKVEQEPAIEESQEDASRNVPFSLDDDPVVIIDCIKGKMIRWRNGVSGQIDEARIPSKTKGKKHALITITAHPKTGRRMLGFYSVVAVNEDGEVYGPERSVYLDKVTRVA